MQTSPPVLYSSFIFTVPEPKENTHFSALKYLHVSKSFGNRCPVESFCAAQPSSVGNWTCQLEDEEKNKLHNLAQILCIFEKGGLKTFQKNVITSTKNKRETIQKVKFLSQTRTHI